MNDFSLYEPELLLNKADVKLSSNNIYGLVGVNGCGKSSLINYINANERAVIGKYNQHFADQMPMDITPVHLLDRSSDFESRKILGTFGLNGKSHGLRNRGVDVNSRNDNRTTALIFASCNNSLECVQILLDHGAKPNLEDKDHDSALMCAAYYKNKEITELLIKNGAHNELRPYHGTMSTYMCEVADYFIENL